MSRRSNPRSAYVVLIGDLVRSRRLRADERANIQVRLRNSFRQINRDYADSICTPLQFTGGDEFQGVLTTPVLVFKAINKIRESASPVPVRFGIGVGAITTPVSEQLQEMDGPAFHRARDAVEGAQEFLELASFLSGQPDRDEEINAWINVLTFIRSAWSDRAREVIRLYEEFQKLEPIARKLDISVQAVSKHLRTTGYKAYLLGEKVLLKHLRSVQPNKVEQNKSTQTG